jgi:predicted transcriptional regulator
MIFSGKKVYEYRKRVFTRSDVDKVYVYVTKPICRIVGYFTIGHVIEDSPYNVWEMTYKDSGINKEYFDAYFKNCDMAHAIKIGEVVKLDNPIDPKEVIKDFHAPQNFMYVNYDI